MKIERKTTLGKLWHLEHKVLDSSEGIVEALVSVTNNRDKGGDVILAGAHNWGLKQQTPKGVWSHDWTTPVSKTLEAYEIMPGDKALPGELLDAGLGALYVRTQFNLKSTAGSEAFSQVEFYGADQEWSIGYEASGVFYAGAKVNAAQWEQLKSKLPAATVDLIESLDEPTRFLPKVVNYEYSPVLFGMNPMTVTSSVKDAAEGDDLVARVLRIERILLKSVPSVTEPETKETPEMEVKVWVEADVPGTIEEFMSAVREAAQTWMDANIERAPAGQVGSYPWCAIVATYTDSVIARIDGMVPDASGNTGVVLQFPMAYDGSLVTLGEPTEVELSVNITPVNAAATVPALSVPGVNDMTQLTSEDQADWREVEEAISYLAADIADEKVTPAQARRRVARAQAALDALAELLPGMEAPEADAPAVAEAGQGAAPESKGGATFLDLLRWQNESAKALL